VVLIGRCQRDLPDNWIYIHDETVKVGRVQNFRSWSPDMIRTASPLASASNISASKATASGPPRMPI